MAHHSNCTVHALRQVRFHCILGLTLALHARKYWQERKEKEPLMCDTLQHCRCVLCLSYSRIFLLLQPLPLQAFLLPLLLLFLFAVSMEGRSIHIVAGDAKSSTKTVILLLVSCSQSMSLCHPARKQTKQLCINDTAIWGALGTAQHLPLFVFQPTLLIIYCWYFLK